jgi:rubrerythrin
MSDEIMEYIALSFAEESKAAVRNDAFALKAEQGGHPEIARLFRAMANADSVHARRFLYLMRGKIGTTEENLREAFENERKAKEEHYPPMVQAAKNESKATKKAFMQSMHTDGEHSELCSRFMKGGSTSGNSVYYVCQICGHIHLNEIPENCPICHAVPGRFKRVD